MLVYARRKIPGLAIMLTRLGHVAILDQLKAVWIKSKNCLIKN